VLALLLASLLPLLAGCASLLPTSRSEIVSTWGSYEEAVQALGTLRAYQATRADVHAIGLDPRSNPAITVLHFADMLQRFSTAPLLERERLDAGMRDCLLAGRQCTGYAVSVRKIERDRIGSFWLDSLNFRRETATRGWSVEALLVFVDDRLVYVLVGGQPTINQYDVVRNPLGPLQGWGDQVINVIR
jgi:hypothetical protein